MSKSRTKSPYEHLSFIADRKKAGLPAGRFPRCFWNVKPTGRYEEDCDTGGRLALEYLSFIAAGYAPDLQGIVADMPRKLTGIEVGFLTMVGYAAQAGQREAARLSEFWKDGMAKRAKRT